MNTPIPNGREATEAAQDSGEAGGPSGPKICIVGASGKLGRYLVQHALDRGYEVVGGVPRGQCGEARGVLGAHHDRSGSDGRPTGHRARGRGLRRRPHGVGPAWGPPLLIGNGSGGARPGPSGGSPGVLVWVPHHARWPGRVLVEGQGAGQVAGRIARLFRLVDLDDQVEACRRIFASDTRWTVVRGSDLEEGESQGLPVWSRHVGDPILKSNLTRRVDFARFMVEAIDERRTGS